MVVLRGWNRGTVEVEVANMMRDAVKNEKKVMRCGVEC